MVAELDRYEVGGVIARYGLPRRLLPSDLRVTDWQSVGPSARASVFCFLIWARQRTTATLSGGTTGSPGYQMGSFLPPKPKGTPTSVEGEREVD